MTLGLGTRLVLTTAAFVIVSRAMGASEFGAFGSVAALVGTLGAFSGWGADVLVIRAVAQRTCSLEQAWGSCLAYVTLTAPPLLFLAWALVPFAVNPSISTNLILTIGLADIFFARINVVGAACYRAVDRPIGAVRLYAGFSAVRLVAAVLWVWSGNDTASSWGCYYCAASAGSAIVSLLTVSFELGAPVWYVAGREWWRDGFQFSLLSAFTSAGFNIATPAVAWLSDLRTAGALASALRIVDAAATPVTALMFSMISRFFSLSADGDLRKSRALAIRTLPIALGVAVIGTAAIAVIAPLAPWLLGESYAGINHVILVMSGLPLLYAFYYLAADVLMSSKHVGARVVIQCAMPFVAIAFCVVLVPLLGAVGAALAVVLTYALMALAAWAIVMAAS